jgi:hypothetical protein
VSYPINNWKQITKVFFLASYYTRHYQSSTGTEAANWLFNQVKSVASANSAITVQQFKHRFNQPSVIAKIPGETSNLGKPPSSPKKHANLYLFQLTNTIQSLSVPTWTLQPAIHAPAAQAQTTTAPAQ